MLPIAKIMYRRWQMNAYGYEALTEWRWRGKTEALIEELASVPLSHTNLTFTGLGMNLALWSQVRWQTAWDKAGSGGTSTRILSLLRHHMEMSGEPDMPAALLLIK